MIFRLGVGILLSAAIAVSAACSSPTEATATPACDGVAGSATFNGDITYAYVATGRAPLTNLSISAEYHGHVTATLSNQGANTLLHTVTWSGPAMGSASQSETIAYPDGSVARTDGAGPAINNANATSVMSVTVDLVTCTYRADLLLAIDITRTELGVSLTNTSPTVHIAKGRQALQTRASLGGFFGFDPLSDRYPAHVFLSDPAQDIFYPMGFAQSLMVDSGSDRGFGTAEVSWSILR